MRQTHTDESGHRVLFFLIPPPPCGSIKQTHTQDKYNKNNNKKQWNHTHTSRDDEMIPSDNDGLVTRPAETASDE